jgi:hypothetical protein
MFKGVLPMVESIVKDVRSSLDMGGKMAVEILDQGDAVGAWYNEDMLIVVFPTGDTITKVCKHATADTRLVLLLPGAALRGLRIQRYVMTCG